MFRNLMILTCVVISTWTANAQADIVTDWSATTRTVIQGNGAQPVNFANPGYSTRSIAMTNGAIYDVFQAFNRTNKPFLKDAHALPNASLAAAVNQAAYEVLLDCYASEGTTLLNTYNARMAAIPNDINKTNGMNLGSQIAQAYIANRANDHSTDTINYTPGVGPGLWRPDPLHPSQTAWGPAWGAVRPFGIPNTSSFVAALPPPPGMTTQAYTDAFNQVKDYGALNSPSRTSDQTDIGLFWGYDRPTMGPPGVLFLRNMEQISDAVGNTPQENARMFAMASVSMADAAIAAWDAKFQYNYWRPVAAIREADTDGNANTSLDLGWRPLGAPGLIPTDNNPLTTADIDDDFTPPFPSWTSGHATMGSALYNSLELFYGTNDFGIADANRGADPVTNQYTLDSQEFNINGVAGMSRVFNSFTQTGVLDVGTENSPEGENGMSRVYLGVHWIFDQRDGMTLGGSIANYVNGHYFQTVPEPAALTLGSLGLLGAWGLIGRRRG